MAYTPIETIFEDSIISALNSYGINAPDSRSENYSNFNQRSIFLRDAVYNQLINEYAYNPSLVTRIGWSYDSVTNTTTYDQDFVNSIVVDYVKNHIIQETGRMQLDAEKKILQNLVEGEYFKEGASKKLIENLSEVISPGSSRFSKLTGAKASKGNENAYRKAVLDYIYPTTASSLDDAIEKIDKVRGKDDRPKESPPVSGPGAGPATPLRRAGQSIQGAVVDILESKTKEGGVSSPYMSTANDIKSNIERSTESLRNEVKELRKELGAATLRGDRATVEAEIENKLDQIHTIVYGTTRVRGGARTIGAGSPAERLVNELNSVKVRLVDTLPAGRGPVGAISPRTDFLIFGGGYGTVGHDVWEVNPTARLKLIEYQTKRAALSGITPLTDYYDKLIRKYQSQLTGSSGDTREAITFKINELGEVVLTDRLRSRYDRAVKNFSNGLYKLDVPAELNKFRLETFQINQKHILDLKTEYEALIARGVTLTPEQLALFNSATDLAKRFEVHAQALSILEGMRFVTPSEMLKFGRMKSEFITNIDLFESDPAKKAQIIDAVRANDYRALRFLITSGAGGTSTDKKTEALYKEFLALGQTASKVGTTFTDPALVKKHESFLKWANKVSLDNELIRGFVLRRHVENAVYAAQLMTNPKYLKSEIKTHFQREVVRRIGNGVSSYFEYRLKDNPLLKEFVGGIYEAIGDPEFQKDWKKYVKTKGMGIVKKSLKEWVNKTEFYKKYATQKFLGVEVELDIVEFVFAPKKFLVGMAKNIAWTNVNKYLNELLRRSIEKRFMDYQLFKRFLRRYFTKLKTGSVQFASRILTTYFGRFGSWAAMRLAGIMAGLTVPVAGWIVTAVLVVLPIILRPIIGDKDLGQLFKDFLKFLLLGPCLIILLIYMVIIIPIISLFSNFWESLWGAVTGNLEYYFNDEKFEESLLSERTFGGLEGSLGSYNLGTDMVSGLVNTTGNKCVDDNNRPLMTDGAINGWNNLKPSDFQGITGPTQLNCRIMCNAQRLTATLYPGIKSDKGTRLINCSSTETGQERFNMERAYGDALQRYWCTYTIMDAYVDDFSDISNTDYASVFEMNKYFARKVANNQGIMRIGNEQCFDPNQLMSGAAIIMTASSCNTLASDNHAALFLKIENGKFIYVNSNSGVLKETADIENCPGGGIRIAPKVYNRGTKDELRFDFCSFYQPDINSFNPLGRVCPTDCIPDKNNY